MKFHKCKRPNERGSTEADPTLCGTCHRTWCDNCDPAPGPLCPWCHGYGYSTAPLRAAMIGGVSGYVDARRGRAQRKLFGSSEPRTWDAAQFESSLPCDSCGKREPCGCDQGM